jgi:hypothetical protein
MTSLDWIDGELSVIRNDEVTHVFERTPPLSRTAYKHMCAWVLSNFESKFNESHETLWAEAGEAWNSLTPETQGLLFALQAREEQMIKDIRLGLLATLAGYQGLKTVKDKFAEAIRSVE